MGVRATTVDVLLSRQEEGDLAYHVTGAKSLRLFARITYDHGLALFDEVDGDSVVVELDDVGTVLDVDPCHPGREYLELLSRKIVEYVTDRSPCAIRDAMRHHSAPVSPCLLITSPRAAKSGGPPAAASRIVATSRK
jgi:hypothetical protein